MRTGHGDIERVINELQIPGRAQSDFPPRSREAVFIRLLSGPGDRLHSFRIQIDFANQMVFSVRNVQRFAVQRHALRSIESCSIEWPVVAPMSASANRFD